MSDTATMQATGTGTLDAEQVDFFWKHGFLQVEQVYTPTEMDELDAEIEQSVVEWARLTPGWSGDWRKAYMDAPRPRRRPICG